MATEMKEEVVSTTKEELDRAFFEQKEIVDSLHADLLTLRLAFFTILQPEHGKELAEAWTRVCDKERSCKRAGKELRTIIKELVDRFGEPLE
jgi:hypothetical protein